MGAKHKGPVDDTPEGLQHLLGRHGSAVGELPDPLSSERNPPENPQNETPSHGMNAAAHDIVDSIHRGKHEDVSKALHDFMTLREQHMKGGPEGSVADLSDNATIDGQED